MNRWIILAFSSSFQTATLRPSTGRFHGAPCSARRYRTTNVTTYAPAHARSIIQCRRGPRGNRFGHSDGRRPNRVAEMIRREIGPIIDDTYARVFRRQDGSAPVLISVVNVKCSEDLRNVRVNVSVYGTDEEKQKTLEWLRKARKEIRYKLAQSIHLKYIPELSFHESEMLAAVQTVDIINKLSREREEKSRVRSGDDATSDETDWKISDNDLDYDASADDALIFEDDEDDVDGAGAIIVDIESDEEERNRLANEAARDKFNEAASSNLNR